ncbi:Pimeloyl-ACP methyl ester carboxylesterase [Solimonas aquatica]|uniref:Pimeloyl-ACP methyl ester carboxylesterase n=1 Tax=Solimonas aquatica TaxID=489703 RepID=A0A1H9KA44_9GAMM|nr:alpha/beta hydrolase [Solimonas aquatica]SEQ95952.1 Pimeloyl-ACP methyl ester carboxylesterase [Solimonas aquatica]
MSAKLAVQQFGQGPDLVLVHGLGASRAFWYPRLAAPLAAQHRVTLYDLRGHGYSERTQDGYSASAQADDLLRLMDAQNIERAVLIGHSYGGGIVLEAALRAPERCRALCLMDTRIQRLQPELRLHDAQPLTPFEQAVAASQPGEGENSWEHEREVGFRFIEAAARCVTGNIELEVRDEVTPFGEGRGAKRAAQAWLHLLDHTAARAEFLEAGATLDEIQRLRVPALLMYASHTRALKSAQALQAAWPQARFLQIPRSGHFFPMSHSEICLEHLRQFLGELP